MRRLRAEKTEQAAVHEYYHPRLKEQFIKEYRNGEAPKCTWNSIFLRTKPMEESMDKDCCSFTHEEINNLFYSFRASKISSLVVKASLLKSYTDFCIKHNWSDDNMNHYAEFSRNDLMKYVDKGKAELYYYTENEILEIANSLESNRDKYLVLGIFYGIYGEKFQDLISVKKQDLKGNNEVLIESTGELIKVPSVLYKVMEAAADEYELVARNGAVWQLEGDTVYKSTVKNNSSSRVKESIIRKRYEKLKLMLDKPTFSSKQIANSGFCNAIIKMRDESGMDLTHIFMTKEAQALRERYCAPKNTVALINLIKEYEYIISNK